MFKLFLTSLLMLAGWACPGDGQCAEPGGADRSILLALAAESDAYWNAADAGGMAAMFAEDADLRIADRVSLRSRERIRGYFEASFAQRPAGLFHVTEIVGLREIAPGVVLADGLVRLERARPDGRRELLRRFANHTLVVREDGRWWFKSLRAHPLADAPPPAG